MKKQEKLSIQQHRGVLNNQELLQTNFENFKEQSFSKQEELKKLSLETKYTLNNQIKQQGRFHDLILDLKTPKARMEEAAKVEIDQRFECKICMEKSLDTVLTPCGHTMCFECANTLKSQEKDCPTCREKITSLQKVFF